MCSEGCKVTENIFEKYVCAKLENTFPSPLLWFSLLYFILWVDKGLWHYHVCMTIHLLPMCLSGVSQNFEY